MRESLNLSPVRSMFRANSNNQSPGPGNYKLESAFKTSAAKGKSKLFPKNNEMRLDHTAKVYFKEWKVD
jgi:hypothetical protein